MEALSPRKDESYGGTEEIPGRASGAGNPAGGRFARDLATKVGAVRRVGEQLGIHPETLRTWVAQAEVDEGNRPGVTSAEAQRIAEVERESKKLRRAHEMLRTALPSHRPAAPKADHTRRPSPNAAAPTPPGPAPPRCHLTNQHHISAEARAAPCGTAKAAAPLDSTLFKPRSTSLARLDALLETLGSDRHAAFGDHLGIDRHEPGSRASGQHQAERSLANAFFHWLVARTLWVLSNRQRPSASNVYHD
ncbi:transposase [Kribbella steppae]